MCRWITHPPTSDNPVFRCADGDMCRFGTLTVQAKHKCTCGCGGYLHGAFCGVQEKKKIYFKKSALMTHMCQKCAKTLGKIKLTYNTPINTEDEECDSKEEWEMKNRPGNNLCLSIISMSPSPVHKKQLTSSARGKTHQHRR